MGSRNTGISLLELVIVIGLLSVIAGLSMLASMDMYHAYLFHGERDKVVEALQKARGRAINNICFGAGCANGRPHGVRFESENDFVVFQAPYSPSDPANDEISFDASVSITDSAPFEVIFTQLSGDSSVERDITVADDAGHTSVIHINSEGQILWSN